ncbi:Protein of unknown function [Leuconostoc citreum LBAE C10]|nr:Protein of unknown function [Leuconostoc citreum LBAE C10]
MRRGAK